MKQSEASKYERTKTSDKIFGPDTKAEYVLVDEEGYVTRIRNPKDTKDLELKVNEELQLWANQAEKPYFVSYDLFRLPHRIIIDFKDGDAIEHILVNDGNLDDLDQYAVDIDTPSVICEDEPEEDDHIHKWVSTQEREGGLKENPGVYGNGGGVVIMKHCEYNDCSWTKKTDTWAQNPANGTQGHETVEYMEVRE